MKTNIRITIVEESQVGEARRSVAEVCRRLGSDETFAGKAAIVVTELAHNLVRHGKGGELLIRELAGRQQNSLEILALDTGPGMRNVSECMRDGYSTFGSAGNGLGAMSRLADLMEIHSISMRGTAVLVRLCDSSVPGTSDPFDTGAVSVALAGEDVCGDAWAVTSTLDSLRLMVADGLGHGPFAEQAAREALTVFRANPLVPLPELLMRAHHALEKTRGAAAAVTEIHPGKGQAFGAGVGNIATRLVHHSGSKNLVSDNGTLGASMRRVLQFTYDWHPGMLLVMHSDGLSSQWNLDEYPGLTKRHPSLIAGVLYRDFKRTRDDATVVVVRHSA